MTLLGKPRTSEAQSGEEVIQRTGDHAFRRGGMCNDNGCDILVCVMNGNKKIRA